MKKETKHILREYIATTSAIDSFDSNYGIEDWCSEFGYSKELFFKMYYYANKYLKSKYIIQINK